MKFTLACAVLFAPMILSAAEDESPSFKVIEVQQTGGFAGVNISYRITPDGKFTRKSRRGTAEGKLDSKEAKALSKAVAAIEWKKMPARLRDSKVADNYVYDMHFVIGNKTHRVIADGSSAGKNALLNPILLTLVKIQRVPADKIETDAVKKMEKELYKGFKVDQALLRKQVVYTNKNLGTATKASSVDACNAARRIFSQVSFVFQTRDEVLDILGDPATISDYNKPAGKEPLSPLVYVFDSGFGGLKYTIRFSRIDLLRVTGVQVEGQSG